MKRKRQLSGLHETKYPLVNYRCHLEIWVGNFSTRIGATDNSIGVYQEDTQQQTLLVWLTIG